MTSPSRKLNPSNKSEPIFPNVLKGPARIKNPYFICYCRRLSKPKPYALSQPKLSLPKTINSTSRVTKTFSNRTRRGPPSEEALV